MVLVRKQIAVDMSYIQDVLPLLMIDGDLFYITIGSAGMELKTKNIHKKLLNH